MTHNEAGPQASHQLNPAMVFYQPAGARFTKYLTIYHKIILIKLVVRSTYDSDLRSAKVGLRNLKPREQKP